MGTPMNKIHEPSTFKKPPKVGNLFKEAWNNKPTDKWICEACGSENTNWIPDMQIMYKTNETKYIHAPCDGCLAKEAEREREAERDKQKLQVIKLLEKSNIPPRIANVRFDNLQVRQGSELAFKTLQSIDQINKWIYLYGDNSVGKTFLVGATIHQLAKKLIPCFYFNERFLFRRIRDSFNNNAETVKDIYSYIRKAEVIFWDDFAAGRYTDWERNTAYEILELCETYNKKLVLISNYNLKTDLVKEQRDTYDRIGKRQIARILRNNVLYVLMKNKAY